jgi:hypothetical protein
VQTNKNLFKNKVLACYSLCLIVVMQHIEHAFTLIDSDANRRVLRGGSIQTLMQTWYTVTVRLRRDPFSYHTFRQTLGPIIELIGSTHCTSAHLSMVGITHDKKESKTLNK